MPARETVERFVAQVLSGDHAGAIEDWYADDASMQENQGEPRIGRDGLVAGEKATLARFKGVRTFVNGPVFVSGDYVAINWVFEFDKPDGGIMRIDEIAHQQWKGDKIWRERFYYDPKQMR